MTIDATPRWALPLLFAGQAQKELFHNEAMSRVDMLLHGRAESADLAAAPSSPVIGQCWIVGAGAGGDWAGQEHAIACWTEGGWRFIAPRAGLAFEIADRGHGMRYDGADWQDEPVRSDGLHVDGMRVVGARQAAIAGPTGGATTDSEARLVIDAVLAALRAHGLIAT